LITTPYTYLLKHINSDKFYYGVRYAKGCSPNDFWNTYFTSSKHIKELINTYGKDSFVYEIRKTFEDKKKAIAWEHRVLKRINAVSRNDFINKTDNIAICSDSARFMLGKFQTDKQKSAAAKTGKGNLGRKASDETKVKISMSLLDNKHKLGKKESDETKLKKSLSKLGKPSNAIGNNQPRCSCVECHKEMTSSTIKSHFRYYHNL
jgi:hypothetical protein